MLPARALCLRLAPPQPVVRKHPSESCFCNSPPVESKWKFEDIPWLSNSFYKLKWETGICFLGWGWGLNLCENSRCGWAGIWSPACAELPHITNWLGQKCGKWKPSSIFAPLANNDSLNICKLCSQSLYLTQENGCFRTFTLSTLWLLAFLEYNFYHYSSIHSRIRKKITPRLNSFCSLMWFLRH